MVGGLFQGCGEKTLGLKVGKNFSFFLRSNLACFTFYYELQGPTPFIEKEILAEIDKYKYRA